MDLKKIMPNQSDFIKNELGILNHHFRNRFVRGKPFDGLDDYVQSNEINVFSNRIKYKFDIQKDNSSEYGLRTSLSFFYESLMQGIYGGNLKKQVEIKKDALSRIIEIDLFDEKFGREAKSVSPGRHLKLKDNQIAGYCLLQKGECASKKEITFEIFRHGIKNLESDFKDTTTKSLFKELSTSTKFMISLPFRIVFDIYMSGKCSRQEENLSPSCYNPRYKNSHGSYTRIDSGPLNALIAYPKETLKYFNVELDGLKIIKSRLPKEMKLNRFEISSFPILIIQDEGSNLWEYKFENVLKNRNEKLPIEFNLYIDQFLEEIKNLEDYEQTDKKEEVFVPIPDKDIPF